MYCGRGQGVKSERVGYSWGVPARTGHIPTSGTSYLMLTGRAHSSHYGMAYHAANLDFNLFYKHIPWNFSNTDNISCLFNGIQLTSWVCSQVRCLPVLPLCFVSCIRSPHCRRLSGKLGQELVCCFVKYLNFRGSKALDEQRSVF